MPIQNEPTPEVSARSSTGGDGQSKSVMGAQTLERGLELLELASEEPMGIADLARRSGLSRSVAYRLVGALAGRGYLVGTADGRFRGGSKLLHLGHLAAAHTDLVSIARPHLEMLAAQAGLSAFLGRREGDHSVHLLRTPGTERIAVTTLPGTRRMLPETGMGKALLLDDDPAVWEKLIARADLHGQGHDWSQQMEVAVAAGVVLHFGPEPHLINSVAAPVRNASGAIVAAVNVAAAAQYLDASRMQDLQPLVANAAAAIGAELGAVPTVPGSARPRS